MLTCESQQYKVYAIFVFFYVIFVTAMRKKIYSYIHIRGLQASCDMLLKLCVCNVSFKSVPMEYTYSQNVSEMFLFSESAIVYRTDILNIYFLMTYQKISLLCPFKVQLFADTKKNWLRQPEQWTIIHMCFRGAGTTQSSPTLYVVAVQTVIEHHKLNNK